MGKQGATSGPNWGGPVWIQTNWQILVWKMVWIYLKSLNSKDFYDNNVSLYDYVSDYSIFYLINDHLYLLKVLVGQCELWVKTFPHYPHLFKFMVRLWSEFGAS